MKTRPVKMHLPLAYLIVFALLIGNLSQNINSEEDHDGKCTKHGSDVYQTAVEVDYESKNPKGTKILRKLFSKSSCKCYLNQAEINYATMINYRATI